MKSRIDTTQLAPPAPHASAKAARLVYMSDDVPVGSPTATPRACW